MRAPLLVAALLAAVPAFAQTVTPSVPPPSVPSPSVSAPSTGDDPLRTTFITEGTKSCSNTLNASPSRAKLGLTDATVAHYCSCTVTKMFEIMTPEEFQQIVQTKQVPDELKERAKPYATTCMQEAMSLK